MYLIDAHSLIFQVFHAIPTMTSPAGQATNALFGFTRDLLYLRTEKKPDYLLCAFDLPGQPSGPDLPGVQGPTGRPCRMICSPRSHDPPVSGCHARSILGQVGFEADDIIATVAKAAAGRDLDVFICTTDKDCRQLISDRVRMFNLRKRSSGPRSPVEGLGGHSRASHRLAGHGGDSVDNVRASRHRAQDRGQVAPRAEPESC